MSREIGNIGWFTYDEAFAKIRETNMEKRKVLELLRSRIQNEQTLSDLRALMEWNRV
jgi:hypothetical protein